jgi:hypothetical protein
MKNLLILILLVLLAYYVYTSGTLSRAVQTVQTVVPALSNGNDNATPEIIVTVYSPFGTGATPAPPPAQVPPNNAQPTVPATMAPPVVDSSDTNPVAQPTAAFIPPTLTPPPPTIIIPEVPPTLAVPSTPTPSSLFVVTIETPREGEMMHSTPAQVVGQTAPNAVVSVNDTVGIAGPDGRFTLAVPLEVGPNVLEIIASKPTGEQVFAILTILYQP